MRQRWIPQHGSNHWQSLHVAKDDPDKVAEQQKKPIALQKEPQCREKEPSDDNQNEAREKDGASNYLAFAHEEANGVLRADHHDQPHYEGEIADAEEAAVEEEKNAEGVED